MDSQRLVDSLTAHLALYHSSFPTNPNPNLNPRSAVLRWFSSLPSATRQSALTAVDPDLLGLLLRMLRRLHHRGPGLFFLLPDLPSPHSLPSLCFRPADGLLARAAAADPAAAAIAASILLFSSSLDAPRLDSLTLSDNLVADVHLFVSTMDGISDGRFLSGEVSVSDLMSPWVEMQWLKDKGYYGVEAFVANRIEVALRLAWAESNAGRKQKGGRLKDKGGTGMAGVAANAFWRKKGCVDWWSGLDPKLRKKIFTAFLGKTARTLVNEAVMGSNSATEIGTYLFDVEAETPYRCGPTASWKRAKDSSFKGCPDLSLDMTPVPSSGKSYILANFINRLRVLQEITAMRLAYQHSELEKETIFFSTLGSVHTISDYILRRLRGVLMSLSIDYINLELMGDSNLKTLHNSTEEKLKIGSQKGKNKPRNSKKLKAAPNPSKDHGYKGDFSEKSKSRIYPQEDTICMATDQKTSIVSNCQQKDLRIETPALGHVGSAATLIDRKGQMDKKNKRRGSKTKTPTSKELQNSKLENPKPALSSGAAETELAKSTEFTGPLIAHPISNDNATRGNLSRVLRFCDPSNIVDRTEMTIGYAHTTANVCVSGVDHLHDSGKSEGDNMFKEVPVCYKKDEDVLNTQSSAPPIINTSRKSIGQFEDSPSRCSKKTSSCEGMNPTLPALELRSPVFDNELGHHCSERNGTNSQHVALQKSSQTVIIGNINNQTNSIGVTSYEWPSIAPFNFTSYSSQHLPATTDRLHLDVGRRWPSHLPRSFLPSRPQARNALLDGAQSLLPSPILPASFDWPLMVKSYSRLSQAVTLSYDSGHPPLMQSSFCPGFAAHGLPINGAAASESERKHYGDAIDIYDLKNGSDLVDDAESYWCSEEESDTRAFSGDYNQFFGGGVMYWNPSEHIGTGFSRPPSHSSEDSSWAWREADLNRAIDDMVGLPGMATSYNTNGLASPPATSFCSPFEPLGSGHQTVGYSMSGNDGNGKILHSSVSDASEEKVSRPLNTSASCIEGLTGDQLPYPILRPIVVPSISRKGSRSEFRLAHDHKSPCVRSARRDPPRIKRPPSPVVLCVPPLPRPPPPSPVGDSRKRGFPIVRSGSSSPRHWGLRSWYHEENNSEETHLCLDGSEVVWPSWGNKDLAASPMMHSIRGSLLQDHLISLSHLARDQEHPDVALPVHPPESLDCPSQKASLSAMHDLLHEEIENFCKQVAAENLIKKPYINWAVKRVTRSLQVLWPRSRTNVFGSNVTGLALPTSDVDLVVSLPPVRNLEPIKEAGILEGRNGIKETCLQHAARYLANQDWVRNDSLKTVENTTIPVIMLVIEIPHDINFPNRSPHILDTSRLQSSVDMSREEASLLYHDPLSTENASLPMFSEIRKEKVDDVKSIRLDISFKSPSHTGLQTSELVRELTQQFPASIPLALVLKKFLADRSLDHSYSGGLSSYCLILLITRFLQHEHHIGRPITHNLGSLLMDFLYFFGNVFDPRQMRISIQGSGLYLNRERGLSIDPLHIDDPLYPTNNVGRNCFRIHQCIKAFADAYSLLENKLPAFSGNRATITTSFRLLQQIIPSIGCE